MESPRDIDIEEREDEDDGAEDGRDDVLQSRNPGGYFQRGLLNGKGGVGLGAIVGPRVVGKRCRFWRQRHFAASCTLHARAKDRVWGSMSDGNMFGASDGVIPGKTFNARFENTAGGWVA